MYTVGLDVDTCLFYSATMIIAVPTVLKYLVVGHSFWVLLTPKNSIIIRTRLLLLFTIGGLSGVVSQLWIRCAFHDTYYVVAHFHYVYQWVQFLEYLLHFTLVLYCKIFFK